MTYYVIVPTNEVITAMATMSVNRKMSNVRKNSDESKCLFEVDEKNIDYFSAYEPLTYDEIVIELEKVEWQ